MPTESASPRPRDLPRRALNALERLPASRLALLVFFPLAIVYVATGNVVGDSQSPDAVAAALPAWHLAAFGTLHLDQVLSLNPWLMRVGHHIVSNRQPGVIFFGVPFYELLGRSSHFNMFPAVVAAATASAGAVTFTMFAVERLVGRRLALVAAGVFAVGTATWSVASDTLWPHGPDELFLAAAAFFLSRNGRLLAAVAIACCVPIRAHLAVVALVAGVWYSFRDKSLRPLVTFGVPAAAGLFGLLAYNHMTFGSWSINGGYGYPTGFLLGQDSQRTNFLFNLLGSWFSFDRGLAIWCPLVVVLAVSLRPAWREAPDWVRITAVGGLAYFLIQTQLNFFSGGDRFWSYRLTLESLALSVPLLTLAARDVLRRRPLARRLAAAAVAYQVGTQAIGAIFYMPDNRTYSPWWHSKLAQELVSGGGGPRVVAALTVVAVCAILLRARRPRPATHLVPIIEPVIEPAALAVAE